MRGSIVPVGVGAGEVGVAVMEIARANAAGCPRESALNENPGCWTCWATRSSQAWKGTRSGPLAPGCRFSCSIACSTERSMVNNTGCSVAASLCCDPPAA